MIIRKSYSYFVEQATAELLHIAVDDSLMIMTYSVLMTSAGHPLHNSTVYLLKLSVWCYYCGAIISVMSLSHAVLNFNASRIQKQIKHLPEALRLGAGGRTAREKLWEEGGNRLISLIWQFRVFFSTLHTFIFPRLIFIFIFLKRARTFFLNTDF